MASIKPIRTAKPSQQPPAIPVPSAASAPPASNAATTTSLLALQSEIARSKKAAKPVPAPTDTPALENLSLTDDDGRTLEDRLLQSSPEESAAISAFLARALVFGRGELILQLGPHNLGRPDLAALLDGPEPPTGAIASNVLDDDAEKPVESSFLLPKPKVDSLFAAIQGLARDVNAAVSVMHNPFEDDGRLRAVVPVRMEPVPSCVNLDTTMARWTGRSLRVLVRTIPADASDLTEVRAAVVGNVDSGKSTILGVLTKGFLDDGRGRARVSLFRHKHEIESGRTSSVGLEVLGFTPDGKEVLPEGHSQPFSAEKEREGAHQGNTARKQQYSWEEISAKAAKIIGFHDLAGHERYLKTTLFGLTASSPDFVLLIVGANAGLIGMSKEHLSVALALSVPVVCIVTKVDMTPTHVLESTLKQLNKVLRSPGCRKQPVYVKDVGMACELAAGFVAAKACPIFLVSNVTGEGLPLLKRFLNLAQPGASERYAVEEPLEFSISDVFSVPFVGTVVSGVILTGKVSVGDTVVIGPDSLGAFTTTAIKSIQRKRVNVLHAEAGQSVSFALKRIKRAGVRKGQVILPKTDESPKATRKFEGQTLVLFHNTLISPRYSAMCHVNSVRQTVQIDSIAEKSCIRTGDRATVRFSFIKQAEWLKVGDRFLFREGRTRALGIITALL